MEMFNDKIEVGMQAMIIGTRFPHNSHLIGKIVTVEVLTHVGQVVPKQFILGDLEGIQSKIEGAFVFSPDIKFSGMKPGYSHLNRKYLMPLPPLKESEQQKEKELERV